MKRETMLMKKNAAFILSLLCMLLLSSCWGDFDGTYMSSSAMKPEFGNIITGGLTTTTSVTLNWNEPSLASYTAMRVSCSNGSVQIISAGTPTVTFGSLSSSTEYSFTLTALFREGDAFECANVNVITNGNAIFFIYSLANLLTVRDNNTTWNSQLILMTDIDLNGQTWTPIGTNSNKFTGTFTGNGHTIRNMNISSASIENQGFFGYISGASIEDLKLTDASITSSAAYAAILVGRAEGSCKIEKCQTSGSVQGSEFIGGLIGYNDGGSVSNCSSSATATGTSGDNIGGLVGYNNSASVSNCSASGAVTSTSTTTQTYRGVGGLIGYVNSGTINNCSATGLVTRTRSVIDIVYTATGGLIGCKNGGSIIQSHSTGNIELINTTGNTIIDYVGGLVGRNVSGGISDSYATGTITCTGATMFVGGLIGYNGTGPISRCFTTGNVNASGSTFVGGFAGLYMNVISNCYATGTVTGGSQVGGFSGANAIFTQINNCYSTGSVTGLSDFGGFIGKPISDATITNCCYDADTSGYTAASGTGWAVAGTALPTAQMKSGNSISPFSSWNFSSVWARDTAKNNGYPYLRGVTP